MASPDDLIKAAQGEIGYREGPGEDVNKYDDEAPGHPKDKAWCVTFIVAMAGRAGVSLPRMDTAVVATMKESFVNQGRFHEQGSQPGDIAFFLRGESHASIVEEVHDDGVVCIGGNYSDGVNREQRRGRHNTAAGYGRPDWSAPPP